MTGNVSVGKIISNASGHGNHLYLDLGHQAHWQSNKDIDDYGNKSVTGEPERSATGMAAEGTKVNLLHALVDRRDSDLALHHQQDQSPNI